MNKNNKKIEYPKISLVTTCHNHAKYVGKTIQSVLVQNYPNLQYVVINDGSTDYSEAVIREYAGQLYHWETWPGYRPDPVPALNRGFSYTDGDIMGWLNSDDILLPNSLFVIATVFDQLKEVEWMTGIATTVNARDEIVKVYPYKRSIYDYLNGDWAVIQQESTFWRRTLWDRTGGCLSEDFGFAFDVELWTRFFLQAEHHHLNTIIGAFRKGKQSRSIKDSQEYTQNVNLALEVMGEIAPRRYLNQARSYRFLRRYFGRILRHLSVSTLNGLPQLRKYNYRVIRYDFKKDRWLVSQESPFR